MFFDKKTSKSSEFYYLEPVLYSSITDIDETMNNLIQERHNHSQSCFSMKVSQNEKKLRFTLQLKDLVLHFLVGTWKNNSEAKFAENWSDDERKRTSGTRTFLRHRLHTLSQVIHRADCVHFR